MTKLKKSTKALETLFFAIALTAALTSIVFLFAIIISLFTQGAPIFLTRGLGFIFGGEWRPDFNEYGALPLLLGSFVVTAVALLVGTPFGVGAALYIAECARPAEKEILKPIVELLAGIPSVIYGLFGMAFLAPFIQKLFNIPTGMNALTAGIILGIMIIPIVASLSEDAISAVPKALREASLALGANEWETISKVTLPAATSGVLTSVILGFGRAVGETMVVLMVAGNSAIIPTSLLSPVRPITSAIAAEMGEAAMGSEHVQALFGLAIILFVITFLMNLLTEYVRGSVVARAKKRDLAAKRRREKEDAHAA